MNLSDEARRFVTSHRVAHLATAAADGTPHVVPVCYVLEGDQVYFVVDEKPKRTRFGLRRLRNILENRRVALLVDEYDDDWSRLAYVLMHGRAALVGDRAEYERVLALLRARYAQYLRMSLRPETNPMVRITVERVHQWRMAS